jgi:hypothetical protein
MTRALEDVHAPKYTVLDTGLRHLAGLARTRNATLFFVNEASPNLRFNSDGPSDLLNPIFLAEALRLRSAVVIAHRNVLDLFLCSTDDCFVNNRAVLEPTFLNGSYSPLCFARRSAPERLYVRVHDFDALKTKLRELSSLPERMTQSLTANGFGVDHRIPVVRVEDLAAFQYEDTPGPLRALSVYNWGVLLNAFGIFFSQEIIRQRMAGVLRKFGVRQDELYSDRFWMPARMENGLMQMRADVEALVEEFGFKRTVNSTLIDWTVKHTQLQSEKLASMPRHGLG